MMQVTSSKRTSTRAISKSGDVFYTKTLDIFDALRLKNVYALKRKQDESEHQLHNQNASHSRRVLPVSAPVCLCDSARARAAIRHRKQRRRKHAAGSQLCDP